MFWTKKEVISDEERDTLLAEVPCLYCGGWHAHECWRTKQVDFDTSGKVLGAQYFARWDQSTTIFRHDLEEERRVSVWRKVWEQGVKDKAKKLASKVQDALWTSSYFSWAARVICVTVTLAATVLFVLGMVALVIHATGWLSFR